MPRLWRRPDPQHREGKMATDIKVPTVGESVTEVTVARWLKKVGDSVALDDPLVELETDRQGNARAVGLDERHPRRDRRDRGQQRPGGRALGPHCRRSRQARSQACSRTRRQTASRRSGGCEAASPGASLARHNLPRNCSRAPARRCGRRWRRRASMWRRSSRAEKKGD